MGDNPTVGLPDHPHPGILGRERAKEIRDFIVQQLTAEEFRDVSRVAARQFQVPRQTIHKQLKRLETKGLVEGRGRTKAREHRLAINTVNANQDVLGLDEYRFWQEFAEPALIGLPENVSSICHYGFTEMVNNVIDHSESPDIGVSVRRSIKNVELMISDLGVGVFRKIQKAFELPSLQEALFELTKGKVTTDPSKHTGEGIFYTTRMFDKFRLLSGGLFLAYNRAGDDWLIGSDDANETGTIVSMMIDAGSKHTMEEVFQHYSVERDDFAFNRTNVVLRLLDTGDASFISRSQAKRVLARLPRFREVLLDFEGVRNLGPAFVDEIFRVFRREHPEVHVTPIRMNDEARRMIERVTRQNESGEEPGEGSSD